MPLSVEELSELADLAVRAAHQAGAMIAQARPGVVEHKPTSTSRASQVVTEVDRRSEEIILDVLAPSLVTFGLGLLTEEREDAGGRLVSDAFWCIDPLDGTLPFIEGVPGYAVSIALVARDGSPLIGVIHDPVDAATLHAIRGIGAFRNGEPWTGVATTGEALTVFADRSLVEREENAPIVEGLRRLAEDLGLAGARIRVGAGAVMNACGVLGNAPACYIKPAVPSGGGCLWDFAATSCLFHELGAVASDSNGDALDLNRADSTFMNHRGVLYATDEPLAQRLRQLLEEHSA